MHLSSENLVNIFSKGFQISKILNIKNDITNHTAEKSNIVIGMQGRLLWGNAFIKARYTLADIKNSTGFSDVSVGFAFGL